MSDKDPERSDLPDVSALIDHVIRMWESERVNAERHAAKLRVIVPTATAFAGLLAVAAGRVPLGVSVAIGSWRWLLVGMFSVAYVLIIWGLATLLFRRRESALQERADQEALDTDEAPASSYFLTLDEEMVEQALHEASAIDSEIYNRNLAATLDLRTRNLGEKYRIRLGQKRLVWGFLGTFAVLLAYTVLLSWSGGRSTTHAEGVTNVCCCCSNQVDTRNVEEIDAGADLEAERPRSSQDSPEEERDRGSKLPQEDPVTIPDPASIVPAVSG